MTLITRILGVGCVLLLSACATTHSGRPDYSTFERHRPQSILILPPLNASVEVGATAAIVAASVRPLAESGYYVIPVTNMMTTFLNNGMQSAEDIHAIAPARLQEIFGADAALYITVNRFGSHYSVLNTKIEVSAIARLIDLHSGEKLWENTVNHVSQPNQSGGNILSMLIGAAVNQIVNNVFDNSWPATQTAMGMLFQAPRTKVLNGPYRDDQSATARESR